MARTQKSELEKLKDKLLKDEKRIKDSAVKIVQVKLNQAVPAGYVRLSSLGLQTFDNIPIRQPGQVETFVNIKQNSQTIAVDNDTANRLRDINRKLIDRHSQGSTNKLQVFKAQAGTDSGFTVDKQSGLNRAQQLWEKYNATVEMERQAAKKKIVRQTNIPLGGFQDIDQAVLNNSVDTYDALYNKVGFGAGGSNLKSIMRTLQKQYSKEVDSIKQWMGRKNDNFKDLEITETQQQARLQIQNAIDVAESLLAGKRSNKINQDGIRLRDEYIKRIISLFGTDVNKYEEYLKNNKLRRKEYSKFIYKSVDIYTKEEVSKVITNVHLLNLIKQIQKLQGEKFIKAYNSQVGIGTYDIGDTLKKIISNSRKSDDDFNDSDQGYDFDVLDVQDKDVQNVVNKFIDEMRDHFRQFEY